jgi:hypothetical protein
MSEISKLKAEAKRVYLRYKKKRDEFSCGKNLMEHICPGTFTDRMQFNKIMEELETLDPDCPKGIRL